MLTQPILASFRPLTYSVADPPSWLYIIEGIISTATVAWAWFGLPSDPTRATWLRPEEKEVMVVREIQRQQYIGSLKFEWAEVFKALRDPKVWLTYVAPVLGG